MVSYQDREINSLPELVSTALLAWDRANWYDLRGPLGTVAVVAEERRGWWDDLIRNLFDHRARKLLVLNNSMTEVLLELSRSWYVLAASMEVKIAGPGRRLGRVQRLLNPILRTYELKDAKGEVFAVVRAPVWRYWHYSILDPARGRKLGAIRKCWSGSLTEYFTRGDRFSIDFGDHDWQLEQRCVLLAAMIAIDLDSFESRGAD